MARFLVLTLVTLLGRMVERANKFNARDQDGTFFRVNVRVIYEVANLNLSLATGGLGMMLSAQQRPDHLWVIVVIVMAIFGCLIRGLASRHEPTAYSAGDPDWRWGVIVPNAVGFAILVFGCLWQVVDVNGEVLP